MIKKFIPASSLPIIRKYLLGKGEESNFVKPFYSQCGEDILLAQLNKTIRIPKKGFYIDVGAYHPFEGSNTFNLYMNGWKGINIDPNPRCKPLFDKYRSSDVNLSCGIAQNPGKITYYMIDDSSSMNTFSKENLEKQGMFDSVTKKLEIETMPLSVIIDQYVPESTSIDFLNVDAEGYEMEVLNSINWSFKKPRVIALEQNNTSSLQEVLKSEPYFFLEQLHYIPIAKIIITKTVSTVFYVLDNCL